MSMKPSEKIKYAKNRIPEYDSTLMLYTDAGWSAYTSRPDELISGIKNSLAVYTAYAGNRLVGLARIIGDGKTIVYIQDILVLNAYQRRGIGRKLLAEITQDYEHVRQVVLLTDDSTDTNEFYTSCGFKPVDAAGCRAYLKIKGD